MHDGQEIDIPGNATAVTIRVDPRMSTTVAWLEEIPLEELYEREERYGHGGEMRESNDEN